MKLRRWAIKIHKWIALLIGVQILAWVLGGLIFSVLDIEKVRGVHKIAEQPHVPLAPESIIDLKVALKQNHIVTIEQASLGRLLGRPVWRVMVSDKAGHSDDQDGDEGEREKGGHKTITLDGLSGEILSPITYDMAKSIAEADYAGPGNIESVAYVLDPPTEYPPGGEVWVAQFDDRDNTTLYIHPDSGQVKSRRSTTWRVFDFFWKLHVMDYDDGESFNHPLLIIAALIALIFVVSGFVLLGLRINHRRRLRKARAAEAAS